MTDHDTDLRLWLRAALLGGLLSALLGLGTGAAALGLAARGLASDAGAVDHARAALAAAPSPEARARLDDARAAWHRRSSGLAGQAVLALGWVAPPAEVDGEPGP